MKLVVKKQLLRVILVWVQTDCVAACDVIWPHPSGYYDLFIYLFLFPRCNQQVWSSLFMSQRSQLPKKCLARKSIAYDCKLRIRTKQKSHGVNTAINNYFNKCCTVKSTRLSTIFCYGTVTTRSLSFLLELSLPLSALHKGHLSR